MALAFLFYTMSATAQVGNNNGTPQVGNNNNTSRLKPIFRIASSFLYNDSAKTMYYIDKGLAPSRKYDRSKWVTNFLMLSAQLYLSRGLVQQAIPVLEQADSLAIRDHYDYMIANYEQLMGSISSDKGDFPACIRHNLAFLRYANQVRDTVMILVGLVNISVAYQSEKNHQKGVIYWPTT